MHPRQLLMHHWAIPAVLGSVLAEIAWYLLVQKRSYPWAEMFSSAAIHIMHIPVKLLTPLVVGPVAYFAWAHRLATVPLDTAWGVALLFLGEEFAYYWSHRAGHEVRWMWASHVVHHTPEHIHLASAFRLSLTELLSGAWLLRMPLYLLGFSPLAVGAAMAVNLSYQFFLHTDLVGRLGPLEWILNTPSHHRVHHASNRQYLDRNYGGVLIVFDRLFGTYVPERADVPPRYGLVKPILSHNPLRVWFTTWGDLLRDLASARRLRDVLGYLFMPPGWRPGLGLWQPVPERDAALVPVAFTATATAAADRRGEPTP